MTNTCDVCREEEGRHLFDSWKNSGGGALFACVECEEWLRVSLRNSAPKHCFVCSSPTDGEYSVSRYGVPASHSERSNLCAECRKRLVFNHGEPVFRSRTPQPEGEQ